jgi:hypothetical protein
VSSGTPCQSAPIQRAIAPCDWTQRGNGAHERMQHEALCTCLACRGERGRRWDLAVGGGRVSRAPDHSWVHGSHQRVGPHQGRQTARKFDTQITTDSGFSWCLGVAIDVVLGGWCSWLPATSKCMAQHPRRRCKICPSTATPLNASAQSTTGTLCQRGFHQRYWAGLLQAATGFWDAAEWGPCLLMGPKCHPNWQGILA